MNHRDKQIRTRFRGWKLIATKKTCTGIKGDNFFFLTRLPDFEAALRAGKARVNELEGEREWNQEYTNEALK